MIIMEFCSLGTLEAFLQNPNFVRRIVAPSDSLINSDTEATSHALTGKDDLVTISLQIAHGMAFIASRNIIHRNLKAKNVLLDCRRTAKVADFGRVHEREQNEYTTQAKNVRIPIADASTIWQFWM